MLDVPLARLVATAAFVFAALGPVGVGAQESPDEPAERPPLPDPGWATSVAHGCFDTPFGLECHQVTMVGYSAFMHWDDDYAWYWWQPLVATWTGVLREPTVYLKVEYLAHDGDHWYGGFQETGWGGPSFVGAYEVTFDHGQTPTRVSGFPVQFWRIRAFGADHEERGRATLVGGPMPQATVPEPATVALTATGLLGIAVGARRRRGAGTTR